MATEHRGVDDGEREVPLAKAQAEAEHDPVLAGMIRRGTPLTRNAYLMLAYGHELPEGDAWTAEHESHVPSCFQRPLSGSRRRQG